MAAVGYVTGDPNKVDVSSVGEVGGPAGPLDASGLIPSAQIPGGGDGGGPSLAGTVTSETSYGAAASAGSASTASRGDHTHGTPALASSAPGNSAVGDTAAVGTATTPARADHVHGRESFGSVTAQTAFGASSNSGSASTPARSDHVHGTPAAPTAASVGADPAGTSAAAVTTHAAASDPHGDRADAASKYVKLAGGSVIIIPEGDNSTQALAIRLPTGDRTGLGAPDTFGVYVNTGTALGPTWTRTGYLNEYGMPRVISIADNQTPFRVKQHSASQSANLTDWTDINNVALAWVDGAGRVRAANLGRTLPFSLPGTLATATGKARLYNDTGTTLTIRSVRASAGTAPTGSAIVVDVNKNGATIFTTQANRPAIAAGATTSGKVTNMDINTLADGDYLSVDLDQVGSTVAGSDLVVQVEVY
ncbi:hypothetical protein [Actinoallomurus sp. CA-142502]|uniref:hypothetical protein n=1 Tax=Actinoallomurus sp. CA-142502 TaxID=3239885 RepID=UPI003D927435